MCKAKRAIGILYSSTDRPIAINFGNGGTVILSEHDIVVKRFKDSNKEIKITPLDNQGKTAGPAVTCHLDCKIVKCHQ